MHVDVIEELSEIVLVIMDESVVTVIMNDSTGTDSNVNGNGLIQSDMMMEAVSRGSNHTYSEDTHTRTDISPKPLTSRISMEPFNTSLSFGGCSAVTHMSTPESVSHHRHTGRFNNDERMVSTTIVDSDIPLTAKRVLLRLGEYEERNDPSNKDNAAIAADADSEQTRSVSLIRKLRQSAFQRKMHSQSNPTSTGSIFHERLVGSESMEHNTTVCTSISPTSVRERTLSPLRSILKQRDVTVNTPKVVDDSHIPRTSTLVVGRVEDGVLNLRTSSSPLLRPKASPSKNHTDNHISKDCTVSKLPVPVPQVDAQVPALVTDSLIVSDSSLDGDFDSTSDMITASSILSDTLLTNTSTTKVIASSMDFIQQLRGAAFRRKMNISRSRDSLVAKERNHREHIASQKLQRENDEIERRRQQEMIIHHNKNLLAQQRKLSISHKNISTSFKARPLPSTTGFKGSGGLAGVPKVEKRLPTIPKSPYLGQRRVLRSADNTTVIQKHDADYKENADNDNRQSRQVNRSASSKHQHQSVNDTFKAIPLPKSSSQIGSAGQAGIPKVPKRMVTVPQSPLLGIRRLQVHQEQQQQGTSPSISNSTSILNTKKKAKRTIRTDSGASNVTVVANKKNDDPIKLPPVTPPQNKHSMIKPYIPYSTDRAIKRAEFEQRRIINEQIRIEDERRKNLQLVKQLEVELERLRIEI
jgi:hypothetical protein